MVDVPAPRAVAVWLALALLLVGARAHAQGCCTPGSSPLGGLSGGSLRQGQLELGLWAEGFSLRQAYDGTTQVPDPDQRESRVLTVVSYARVGLLDRVALIVQLPYEYRERTAPFIPATGAPGQDFSNAALGDLSTLVMAQVLPWSGVGQFSLNVGGGIKWATGADDNTQDGLRLPVELQSGTGSTDPLFAAVGYYLWGWGSVSANAVWRFPTRGRSGYEYGNELNYAVTGLWSVGSSWKVGAELRGRTAGEDNFNDFVRPNTGGSRVALGPRVVLAFSGAPLVVEAAFLLPVYQDMNGRQLGVSEGGSLGIRWSL